jgi:hypothetical protein
MSTTTSNTPVGPAAQAAAAKPSKASRRRHTPGGAELGRDTGPEAQRLAAAILDVLAGVRTPRQAAEALGVSLPRYFQVETRAVQALVAACAPRPRGPGRNPEKELAALRRQCQRLERQLSRQQTLVRLAQRTIGLAPPKTAPPKTPASDAKGKRPKRRRQPVVRALRAAELLHQRSQETETTALPSAAAPSAATLTASVDG